MFYILWRRLVPLYPPSVQKIDAILLSYGTLRGEVDREDFIGRGV